LRFAQDDRFFCCGSGLRGGVRCGALCCGIALRSLRSRGQILGGVESWIENWIELLIEIFLLLEIFFVAHG
jgi:hypothetical protein